MNSPSEHNTMRCIELLAPAKDLACGVAAIDCGADAVYIGAPRFGAREDAGNAIEDIAALVQHAHTYWARVYATVNTILFDDEVPQARDLIWRLHEIGVDGVIIQDTGLLECDLPPVRLIASTQMHNNSPERVAFLEQVGFQRAILARELDLDQIRAIRRATGIGLECFVHGALCVGYSGQCYLSCALGGRSGNRGQCAQPCRKPYTLVDSDGEVLVRDRHLLSLRDLNLSEHLRELIEAGVCSFKIEGRLKDRSYVANVVASYRARLDEVLAQMGLEKTSSGRCEPGFEPDLDKTFNRGYSTYFLHGRGAPIGSLDTPKMAGTPMGKVAAMGKAGVTLDTDAPMHAGDGVCFFARNGELRGTVVNSVQGRTFVPDRAEGIRRGTVIYRNRDHEFLTRIRKSRPARRIEVTFTLRRVAEGLVLDAADGDANEALSSVYAAEPANDPGQALAVIRKQLARTGGTIFACSDVRAEMDPVCFVPVAAINAMRREVLDRLEKIRAEHRPVCAGGPIRNETPYPERALSYLGNVANRYARAFYERHGVTRIEPAAETGLDMRGRKLMTTRYCIREELGLCPRQNPEVPRAGPLVLVDDEGRRLELRFTCEECGMEVYFG